MTSFLHRLYKVYDLVYDSVYGTDQNFYYLASYLSSISNPRIMAKPNYSLPKIYTGGVNIDDWKQLSKEEQEKSLKKNWYVYYSFRNPETGLLVKQNPIKGHANSYKKKNERLKYLIVLRDSVELILKSGINPFTTNDYSLIDELINNSLPKKISFENKSETNAIVKVNSDIKPIEVATQKMNYTSIEDAFKIALTNKKNHMNSTSYGIYKSRIEQFKVFLADNSLPITAITKKDAINFLNNILERTSPTTRNNYRGDLHSFFQELENNELIENNFITKINVLKSNPERNKTFSDKTQREIYEYLENNDKTLLLFIKFISYNFLRPVEVCRLKIRDIDVNERKLYLRAKNKAVKIKIIPEILINEIPDLSKFNPDSFLFTSHGFGLDWETEENNKRNYFTKRFRKVVKESFKLNKDFGLYSFRHTFITKLYRKLREEKSPQNAKSELMLITGHTTMIALDKYLRDIDAELPDDYSKLFE